MRGFKYLLPLLACVAACRRDPVLDAAAGPDYGQGTGRCRLSEVRETLLTDTGRHSIKELHYDAQGRLQYIASRQSFNGLPASSGFTYRGDTTVINHLSRSSDDDTVVTGAGGQVVYLFGNFSSDPNAWAWGSVMTYNPQHLLVTATGDAMLGYGPYRYFGWAAADLKTDSEVDGRSYTYEYYPDKHSQYANPLTLPQYLSWGRPIWQSAHLPRYRSYRYYPLYDELRRDTFAYAFDRDGKIISDTIRSADVASFNTFSYECQ